MKHLSHYIAVSLLVAGLAGVFAAGTQAQESQRLQISPPRQELMVDPGDTAGATMSFYNFSASPIPGVFKVADFVVKDDKGTPVIIENPDQSSPRFSGSQWIQLPFDRAVLPANDSVEVQARITVPADARPGGRYVAVYFEPTSGNTTSTSGSAEEAEARVAQRLAALIYIRVSGDITEKALVSSLFAPVFMEHGPVAFQAEILNRGDYHIQPQGSVTLRNMMGGLVDQKKLEQLNIFPDTTRSYNDSLGEKWMMGKYSLTVLASYGSTGQVIERTIDIWIFPWKIALAVIAGLIILVLIAKQLYTRFIYKENVLADQIEKDHEQIEALKEQLQRKK